MPMLVVASLFPSGAPSSLGVKGFFRGAMPKATRLIHVPNIVRVPPSCNFPCKFVPAFHRLLTSPASPATVLLQMLYFYLNFSSQPLEATSDFSAIDVANSWSIEPETGMLEFLHIVCQCHERFIFT